METLADIQLYGRSVEMCRMFYNPFIGGGDSLVYRELCKINLHGLTKLIEKEEDIRHIIKGWVHNYEALFVTTKVTELSQLL